MDKNVYTYSGPVLNNFDQIVCTNWVGITRSTSEKRAKVNLAHQFKTQHNLLPTAKIKLPNKVSISRKEG